MNRSGLSILLVTPEEHSAEALVRVLESCDHRVTVARTGEEALAQPRHDVLVAEAQLDGIGGLDVLEELALQGPPPRTVILSRSPSVDECRRALRLGAADLLTEPFEGQELLLAVERASERDERPAAADARAAASWSRSYSATPEACERAVRDLAAHALRCAVGPAARGRLASAAAEVLENVSRHAYPHSPGPVHVSARVEPRDMHVVIRDEGLGFDAVEVGLDRMDDSRDGGLARVSALAEGLRVQATVGGGTTVRMSFSVYRVLFDQEGPLDLTEEDWFTPDTARHVLEALADDARNAAPVQLSPALAVTLGRLLAGPDPRRVLQTALWS